MQDNFYLSFSSNKNSNPKEMEGNSVLWSRGMVKYSFPKDTWLSKGDLTIYLKGQVFTNSHTPLDYLLTQYRIHGIEFIKKLNGHYLMIMIDHSSETIYLVSDRLNSKKFFIQRGQYQLQVSGNIFSQLRSAIEVDEYSVAQYITSGFVSNSRSLIKGIEISRPASIYTFRKGELKEENYWKFAFSGDYSTSSQDVLREELYELMKASIHRRINNENVYISLSGGYDASSIQFLMNRVSSIKPYCFSYFSGDILPNTDAFVAKLQANLLENELELISAYDGDFNDFIRQNAIFGQGISNISYETNVWNTIKPDIPVFVGEESFGMRDEKTRDLNQIMSRQGFLNWTNIRNPGQFFNAQFLKSTEINLQFGQQIIIDEISKTCNNAFDNQMLLYLNYRLPNVLLNWREFFTGRNNPVQLPLLDYELLDFISKLPYWARNNKYLFKNTLENSFISEFGTINRAKRLDSYPWNKIVKENSSTVLDFFNLKTPVDYLINPGAVEALMKNARVRYPYVNKVRRKINRVISLTSNLELKTYVPEHLLILRLSILKVFFSEFEKGIGNSERNGSI